MARPSQLEGRLLAVLDAHRSRAPLSGRRGVALAFSALLLVVGLGVLRPTVQADTPNLAATEAVSNSKDGSSARDAPKADSDDQVTVTGIVLSPDGKPVASALIEIVAVDYDEPWNHTTRKDDVSYFSTSSDHVGRYEITVLREALKRSQVAAFASAEG